MPPASCPATCTSSAWTPRPNPSKTTLGRISNMLRRPAVHGPGLARAGGHTHSALLERWHIILLHNEGELNLLVAAHDGGAREVDGDLELARLLGGLELGEAGEGRRL